MFKKKIKEEIERKKFLKQKYSKAYAIVKKHIDNLDLMKLFEIGCPKDKYDFEIIHIMKYAIKTKEVCELTDAILAVFNEAYSEDFSSNRDRIIETSKNIIFELRSLNTIEKETYFIPKDLLPGSCYFEFKPGKYNILKREKNKTNFDDSLYLYGDDDEHFDYSAIMPFTYLITGTYPNHKALMFFDYCGITYIDETMGKDNVMKLRTFSLLLGKGKQIIEALEIIGVYNSKIDGSWREEDSIKKLDPRVLKNTAEYLADWMESTLKEYKWISVLGI